jgi:predicted transcriptional regulator
MTGSAKSVRRSILGNLEKSVLDVLWLSDAPLTGRQIHDMLVVPRPLAYTTVMTVVYRLTAKGLLSQRRDERAFRYAPRDSHASLIASHMLRVLGECEPRGRRAALLRFVDRIGIDDAKALLDVMDSHGSRHHQCELQPTNA